MGHLVEYGMAHARQLLQDLFLFDAHIHSNDLSVCSRASVRQWKDFYRVNLPWVEALVFANHSYPPGLYESKIMTGNVSLNDYSKIDGIPSYSGLEVNILKGGKFDVSEDVLANVDWVMGAINPLRREYGERKYTDRSVGEVEGDMVGVIESGFVDVLGHPTANIDPLILPEINWKKIFTAAKTRGVFVEINLNEEIPEWWLRLLADSENYVLLGTDWHGMYQFRKFIPQMDLLANDRVILDRVRSGGRNGFDALSTDEKERFDDIYTHNSLGEDFFDWMGAELKKALAAGIKSENVINSRGAGFLKDYIESSKPSRRKFISAL